jgi:hypothetical protein
MYLDFSDCDEEEKHFITNCIFHMILMLTPQIETDKLTHLIVIDEARNILGESLSRDPRSGEYIMKAQMNRVFTKLLNTHRSKGLGFNILDTRPNALIRSVINSASIKILFRLNYPHNEIFTGDLKERRYLLIQPNRRALVFSGITGAEYLIETLDFKIPQNNLVDFDMLKKSDLQITKINQMR